MLSLASLPQLAFKLWIFEGWQLIAIVLLVVLIIFWLQYRKRQM